MFFVVLVLLFIYHSQGFYSLSEDYLCSLLLFPLSGQQLLLLLSIYVFEMNKFVFEINNVQTALVSSSFIALTKSIVPHSLLFLAFFYYFSVQIFYYVFEMTFSIYRLGHCRIPLSLISHANSSKHRFEKIVNHMS